MVERGFKEDTQTAFVRGKFDLGSNVTVQVLGAPSIAPGKIVVSAKMLLVRAKSCESMDVLVNARPTTASAWRRKEDARFATLEGDFDFQTFKPLAQKFPEFAVRVCGDTWKFNAEQVAALQKFFVMYVDLAKEEAGGENATAAGPGKV